MKAVAMFTVLATVATLPLAAQQPDSSHAGAMPGSGMSGRMGSGSMMQGGMVHRGMMGSGTMGYGAMGGGRMMNGGMMAGWMRYGMGMDSSTMGLMMRTMAFLPQRLLAERDMLKLTGPQVKQLTSIAQTMRTSHDQMWQQAQPHMRDMANLMSGTSPDTAAVKSSFDAAASAMSAAHWAVMNAIVEARDVLTSAQRREVDATSARWAKRWGMGPGSVGRWATPGDSVSH